MKIIQIAKRDTLKNSDLIIKSLEKPFLKINLPKLLVGDVVKIGILIKEGNKDRTQYYQGIIISKKNSGINSKIVVRKTFQGIGIERQFLLHSPKFESIEVLKSSQVRRSKLYYLRKISGKASRLKQKFPTKK